MRPQLADLAKKHGDKVVVLKVNVDRERTLASMAGVRSIPDRRLFIGGRQLEKAVGSMSGKALEGLVRKHEGGLAAPRPEPIPLLADSGPLKMLEARVGEVRGENRRQLQAAAAPVAAPAAAAEPSAEEAEPSGGTIQPMGRDWLPPGVTRVK